MRYRKDRGEYSVAGLIIGTPSVITTVGHGTAFEIAGKGKANPRPMREAVQLVSRSCGGAEQPPHIAKSPRSVGMNERGSLSHLSEGKEKT